MGITQRQMLGKRIRALRVEEGLTQGQLAAMIGNNTKQYISALEKGDKNATIDVLCRIAKALDVSVGDLIEF